ncbi:MAG: DUF368 domain-containing protein [Calditrichia bacterium]
MKQDIQLIAKGGIFGIANIIPGVSGGTMAVVLGIYEYLIEAIGNVFIQRQKRKEYILFLAKVLFGAGISIIVFSWVMDYLLTYYKIYTYLFFIGLIAGSIPSVYRSHTNMQLNWPSVITFLCGIGVIMLLALSFPEVNRTAVAGLKFHFTPSGAGKLFVAGILSGGSMIVPGVSGSFMLVLLGQYQTVIRAVKSFDITPLFFLGMGIALGIWSFAKIIDILLKHYPKETFYFILGLVIGSLYPIYPGLPDSLPRTLLALLITFVAFALSYKLGERK